MGLDPHKSSLDPHKLTFWFGSTQDNFFGLDPHKLTFWFGSTQDNFFGLDPCKRVLDPHKLLSPLREVRRRATCGRSASLPRARTSPSTATARACSCASLFRIRSPRGCARAPTCPSPSRRGSDSKISYRKVSAPRKWASAALLRESELFGAQFFRLHGDSSGRKAILHSHDGYPMQA